MTADSTGGYQMEEGVAVYICTAPDNTGCDLVC